MPDIRMPDGAVVRFPDTMQADEIKSLIAQKFPEETKDVWSRANILPLAINTETGERALAMPGLVKSAIEGVTEGAALPGRVYTGERKIGDLTPGETMGAAALMTPINPAVRSGERAIPGLARRDTKPSPAPTQQELHKTASEGFDAFRKSGIAIGGNDAKAFAGQLKQSLLEDGFLPPDAKSTYAVIQMLERPERGAYLSAAGMHSIRKALGRTARNFSPDKATDQAAAAKAIDAFDDFVSTLDPSRFVAGTPAQINAARETFKMARGDWAALYRSEKLTKLERSAELRTAGTNSGRNLDNAIRQRMASILDNPRLSAGFSKDEIAKMEALVNGSLPTNLARTTSNMFGGGGGIGRTLVGGMAGAGAGGMAGAPMTGLAVGLGVAGTGSALKGIENALTRKALNRIDEATRARSPLNSFLPELATYPGGEDAFLRALLQQVGPGPLNTNQTGSPAPYLGM